MAQPAPTEPIPGSEILRPREGEYPESLARKENAFIRARRERVRELLPIPEGAPAVGLALSGGGIRSATFCLGVLQALARTKVLPRVDLLSTVSGGGYIGSFLGAWFNRASGPGEVSEGLASNGHSEARPVRWLRENGYYLAPTGSADGTLMGAIYLRNWVALQVVLGMLVLAAFLLMNGRLFAHAGLWWPGPGSRLWWSPWILAPMAVFATATLPLGWAYWMVTTPDPPKGRDSNPLLGLGLLLLATATGGWAYGQVVENASLARTLTGVALESVLVLIWLYAAGGLQGRTRVPSAEQRLSGAQGIRARLSSWMAGSLSLAVVLVALGLVDSFGQSIFAVLAEKGVSGLKVWAAGVGGGLVALALAAQQAAQRLPKRREEISLPLSLMAGLAAFLLAAVALVALNALAHGLAWGFHPPRPAEGAVSIGRTLLRNASAQSPEISFSVKGAPPLILQKGRPIEVDHPSLRLPSDEPLSLEWASAGGEGRPAPHGTWFGWSLGVSLGLSLLFGGIRSFLNASAMGSFYQRRLTRAYLGATNPERGEQGGTEAWRRQSIREALTGDDLPWVQYRPFEKGGPLHFVFTTVNETVDGKSQVQQRDRKGLGMAVGPAGLSVGVRHHATWLEGGPQLEGSPKADPQAWSVFPAGPHAPEPLSLGQWLGISGAAFSTGMGFRTSAGLSLLCGMFNVRTGYWWWSGVDRWKLRESLRSPGAEGFFSRLFPVQAHLLDELRGRFPGTAKRHWYLSDGGHFENSAIYELARRRVPIILACDAGEDSGYLFDDLANLTLKLRADFRAELTVLEGDEIRAAGEDLQSALGLANAPSLGPLEHLRRGEWESKAGAWSLREESMEGTSLAHAAAVRIDYPEGGSSLVLIFKPALTGDEPRDVAYYHAQHPAFPHEPTLDQFFDEAQWEAYRKLGEHAAHRVLGS